MSSTNTGAWTEFRFSISTDELKVLEAVMKHHLGVNYSPIAIASQVVDGHNYCFLCKAHVVSPQGPEFAAEIYVHQPLHDHQHAKASITRIVHLKAQSKGVATALLRSKQCTLTSATFHYHQGENVSQANSPLRVQLPVPDDGTYSWTWDTSKPRPNDCVDIVTEGYCGFFNELILTWKHQGQTTAYFVSGGMGGAPGSDTLELQIVAC